MPVKEPPYDVGDEVELFAEFENAAGAPANPTDATLQIGRRDGTILHTFTLAAAELANPVVGTLERAYVIEETGLRFSWDAEGVVTLAAEGVIPTRRRALARPG